MNMPTYHSSILQIKAYRTLQARVNGVLGKFGLNSSQWSILGQIYERAGLRFSDVAALLGVEPALITMMTEPLLDQGLVQKVPHSSDKRSKILVITDSGRQRVKEVEQLLQSTLEPLLSGASKSELSAYQRVLETIVQNDASH
jgi:DNA-binding MarR family transcriptional regulator